MIAALLAGEAQPLVRSGHIRVIDRFLDTADFAAAIGAMDVVATPYPRHIGSASIVLRRRSRRPAGVGGTFGWIGYWVVPRFGLGRTVDVADPVRLRRRPDPIPGGVVHVLSAADGPPVRRIPHAGQLPRPLDEAAGSASGWDCRRPKAS